MIQTSHYFCLYSLHLNTYNIKLSLSLFITLDTFVIVSIQCNQIIVVVNIALLLSQFNTTSNYSIIISPSIILNYLDLYSIHFTN